MQVRGSTLAAALALALAFLPAACAADGNVRGQQSAALRKLPAKARAAGNATAGGVIAVYRQIHDQLATAQHPAHVMPGQPPRQQLSPGDDTRLVLHDSLP